MLIVLQLLLDIRSGASWLFDISCSLMFDLIMVDCYLWCCLLFGEVGVCYESVLWLDWYRPFCVA